LSSGCGLTPDSITPIRQRNAFYPLDVTDKLEEETMTKVEA